MKQIILLYGEDAFALEEFEKNFISEKVSTEWETFNLEILDGSDISADRISESVNSPPFGFGDKVTLVKKAGDLFAKKEDELTALTTLFQATLMPTNFLIFSADSVDKRKTVVKKLLEVAEVKEFAQLKPWEVSKKLYPWVEDYLRKFGKRIEREALQELVEATASNKHRLERELEKLMLYIKDVNLIKFQDVRALVSNTESDLFEFIDYLSKKEVANALMQINNLLLKEKAIKIIASVSSNMRSIYNVKLLAENDMSINDIAKQLGQKPFIVEKNVKAWRSFKTEKLREVLEELMNLDFKFKTGSINDKLELEKFIIKNFSR